MMSAFTRDPHPRHGAEPAAPSSRAQGKPLEPELRAYFEPLLGHDLSQVRVHAETSGPESLGAAAVTVGTDVSFGPGWYAPETPRGRRLLAHELTHVVQQAGTAGPSSGVSQRADPAEQEAESAADLLTAGAPVSIQAPPSGAVAPGLISWIEDEASDAWDAVSDVASDAWDVTRDVGSGIYAGMQGAAGYIRKGVDYAKGGITWVEDEVASGAHWLEDKAEGIPVLEQLADLGGGLVEGATDLTGGLLKSGLGLAGGVAEMAVDPVDTAKGLESMAEHIPILGMPLKAGHKLLNAATGDGSMGDVLDAINPITSIEDDASFYGKMGSALLHQYQPAMAGGHPLDAAGNILGDVLAIAATGGESAVAEVGEASELVEASKAAEVAETAEATNTARELASVDGRGTQYLDPWPRDLGPEPPLQPHQVRMELPESGLTPGTERAIAEGAPPGTVTNSGTRVGSPQETSFETLNEERVADRTTAAGKRRRADASRAQAREDTVDRLGDLRERGQVNQEFIDLADEVGLDKAQALAEGEIGYTEAGAEASHEPLPLAEDPQAGAIARGKGAHRRGIHGNNFQKGSEYQPVDPLWDEHVGLQPPSKAPKLSAAEMDTAEEAGAVEGWRDRLQAIEDGIDQSRDPSKVEQALADAPVGKGRGGPRLSEAERAAREQADLDRSIVGEYTDSSAPKWMKKKEAGAGSADIIDDKWSEAMEWLEWFGLP